jgi:hypothetical protein
MGGFTRVFARLLAVAWVMAVVLGLAAVAGAQGEEAIHSFAIDITVRSDGSLLVEEAIEYDFGTAPHHGIFRDIPDRLTYDGRYDRVFPIDVLSVEGPPGTPTHYVIQHDGNLFRIKIGDADRTITGTHVYRITYRVEGAINGFPDHDELYWNALGTEWQVPIDSVSVTVRAPSDIQRVACFAGPAGSNLPCERASAGGGSATFSQAGLGPFEGLTIVVGLPKSAVPSPHPILRERWTLQRAFSVTPLTAGLAGAIALLAALGLGYLFWVNGRDRRALGSPVDIAYATSQGGEQPVPLFEHGPTPVEYAPPDEIRPGQVGTLVDEVANPLDVTATIVDLAVRGYLRIEEIPKRGLFGKPDWRLVRLKESDGLLPYEGLLLKYIFRDEDEEEGAADRDGGPAVKLSGLRRHFSARLRSVQDSLYEDAVKRGWFAGRPDRVRHNWTRRGWVAAMGGTALVVLAAAKTHLALIALPIALGGLALVFGARWMPRRTPKGTGLVRRVLGFKTYIETAEVEESKFAERKNLFSQYLPYAVVFGCTEKWARAFAHLGDQPPETSWYVGPNPFTVATFTSSIDDFSVATAGTITSTPAGSGVSGFGGGGFSGGGGGGGGGGSW